MRRGDIYWCDIGSVGAHPVVLLSRDGSYRVRSRATVALVTSRVRGIPVEAPLVDQNGVREGSVVNVDDVFTVRTNQLRERDGSLDTEQMKQLDAALRFALGLGT